MFSLFPFLKSHQHDNLLQFIDLVALCPSRNLSDALAFTSERRDLDGSPGNLTVLCTSACIPSRCSHQGMKTRDSSRHFETSESIFVAPLQVSGGLTQRLVGTMDVAIHGDVPKRLGGTS